jgi:hypothetical protein
MDAPELTLKQARALCTEYLSWHVRRDHIFRTAYAAGLGPTEIARLTGHGRATVERALQNRTEQEDRTP